MSGSETLITNGKRLQANGDFQSAADAFSKALEHNRTDRDCLLSYATCLKHLGDQRNALRAYLQLTKHHPDYSLGWRMFGVLLKNRGRYHDAISALERSLSLEEDIDTRNSLVVCLFKIGSLLEAKRIGQINLEAKHRRSIETFSNTEKSCQLREFVGRVYNRSNRRKNVISFSLWGNDPTYTDGAITNARIAPHIYYGWKCRFYCDATVPPNVISTLRHAGSEVVMITDPYLAAFKPMWRFLASDDTSIDWFICRDADSRLNCHELLAVEEWLCSGKPFHVMRDHIYHMELMLAGMWGGAAGILPNMKELLASKGSYRNNRFADQQLLAEHIWPLIYNKCQVHDSVYEVAGSSRFPSSYRLPGLAHVGGAVKIPKKELSSDDLA